MCGIVGIVRSDGAPLVPLEDVRRMADAIVHRGPDDEGFYASEHAVLGMRRLSIIDLSGGHQPIANEDSTLRIVCNGEIYNFRELRSRLEAAGHRFRTGSDVETLLHLYEQHGDAFVDHLEGMYGFALWDQRRQRLVLGRDRMGQKPLYYTVCNGVLAFASEVKALLALPFVRAAIDPDALREYLALGYAVAPRTIFKGIFKLPPASVLTWERGEWHVRSYWRLPTEVDEGPSEREWVERLRGELERAVASHMVSDVPIGAFLSGGMDSSAVVALMAKQGGDPVNTYSIGYGGSGVAAYYNELSYAGQVARRFGTRHHEILVHPDVATLLPKLLWHLEEPISDSATATTYLVSELASRSVKVILSGVGGDELFAGYNRYLGDHYMRAFARIPGWVRRNVLRPLTDRLPSGRQSRLMDLSRYARRFVRASDLPWGAQYRLFMEIVGRDRLQALVDGNTVTADGFERVVTAETAVDPLLRLLRIDAATQLPEDLLLLTDKITMARSIECRVPFLDHRLVETAARVPARFKLPGGRLKHLLREVLAGTVPEDVLRRRKRGFGAPVGEWFKTELRPLRQELLRPSVIESRGLLSADTVARIVADHDARREDYSDLLLVLMNLEIWCRLFLDRRAAGDVSDELASLACAA